MTNTLNDAKTMVDNSGVVDWDWGKADDALDCLAEYLFRGGHEGMTNEVLAAFIRDELGQDPADYSLRHAP